MIRDDPDSRARMRATPEQILNLPVHYCLASWIAGGSRAASFIGQTFPFPTKISDAWARIQLERLQATVGPYPETMASTLERDAPKMLDREPTTQAAVDPQPRGSAVPEPAAQPAPEHPEPRVDRQPPVVRPDLAQSPVRRVVGRPVADPEAHKPTGAAPASVRELAFIDRINEVREPEHLAPSDKPPRLYDTDYAILALLDRAGLVLPSLIGRAVLPGKEPKTVRHRLNKLYEHGLIARAAIGVSGRSGADGRLPWLYTLTRHGHETAQTRNPPAIHPQREWRALEQRRAGTLPHNLHALAWAVELHRVVGELATDYWRTPRYATGRYPVPQIGNGHKRHPITMAELDVPDGHAILDLPPFREIKPDVSLELRIPSLRLTFDLLVELDLTGRASYNREKFSAYDAFLTGWALTHPRFRTLQTRPVVVFVCPDARTALAYAAEADQAMTGRIGVMGAPPHEWYYPGRDHVFFAVEPDIHHDSLTAFALPPHPPEVRKQLEGSRRLQAAAVALLPHSVTLAQA